MAAQGIDVSNNNGNIDWTAVKHSGIEFAFVKTSEGHTWADSHAARNVAHAMTAGIDVGVYHFARPDNNQPRTEAEWFAKCAHAASAKYDLPPMLDWELSPNTGKPGNWRWEWALEFLKHLESIMGVTPGIYMSPGFWQEAPHGAPGTTAFARYPLWIAHWGVSRPTVPAPWKDYAYWQTSDSGKVGGISGRVDMNVRGTVQPTTGEDRVLSKEEVRAVVREELAKIVGTPYEDGQTVLKALIKMVGPGQYVEHLDLIDRKLDQLLASHVAKPGN